VIELDNRELVMLQSLPLDIKIEKSKQRIREAINKFGVDGVYVPLSGGIDSQVVHLLVKEVQEQDRIPLKKIPRVFSNTGNEYDSVVKKARELCDIEVRPSKPLWRVLTEEGYPVGSKKVSRMLRDLQNPTENNFNSRRLYLEGIKQDGTKTKSFKMPNKWKPFIKSEIRASEKCCYWLKKEPMNRYEKETGRIPILGVMADEGGVRKASYLQTGCNAFKSNHPQSKPIGFWLKDDSLAFTVWRKLLIPDVYGDIVIINTPIKAKPIDIIKSIHEGYRIKLDTTGEKRTGCVYCTYGVTQEKGENRFQKLYKNDKRKYDFAIKGGKIDDKGKLVPGNGGLGIGKILDLMGINYKPLDAPLDGQIGFDI
jgi:3'-phosphoadenosine 5'-phosphosulfate sulfotransferase (PAPS reductase)/FAD synthetase